MSKEKFFKQCLKKGKNKLNCELDYQEYIGNYTGIYSNKK